MGAAVFHLFGLFEVQVVPCQCCWGFSSLQGRQQCAVLGALWQLLLLAGTFGEHSDFPLVRFFGVANRYPLFTTFLQ